MFCSLSDTQREIASLSIQWLSNQTEHTHTHTHIYTHTHTHIYTHNNNTTQSTPPNPHTYIHTHTHTHTHIHIYTHTRFSLVSQNFRKVLNTDMGLLSETPSLPCAPV